MVRLLRDYLIDTLDKNKLNEYFTKRFEDFFFKPFSFSRYIQSFVKFLYLRKTLDDTPGCINSFFSIAVRYT